MEHWTPETRKLLSARMFQRMRRDRIRQDGVVLTWGWTPHGAMLHDGTTVETWDWPRLRAAFEEMVARGVLQADGTPVPTPEPPHGLFAYLGRRWRKKSLKRERDDDPMV